MTPVTTLRSRRSQEIDEAQLARPPVPRKARHARDPAGAARDGPRLSASPGLGLADADPDERSDGAPASAPEASAWPCRPRRGPADHPGGEARGDQLRLVHQDEPLPRDQGGAAAELLRVGEGARIREACPQGAEARAGCAGTAPSIPGRPRPGPHGWLAARITQLSPKPRRQELVRSRRAARGGLGSKPVAFRPSPPPPFRKGRVARRRSAPRALRD